MTLFIVRDLRLIDVNSVWQIAQRDYKFGKGKFSSLTKATYDAVGDKFRSLWGKEAGWAHSVLFTADLRTFSERLSAKVEVTEGKKEEETRTLIETQAKAEVVSPVRIKRERMEEKEPLATVPPVTSMKRVKRRRKA